MKAILIDDERPALLGLEYMLKKYEGIQVIGMYANPVEGIEAVKKLEPDVVFLDMEMPQLRGIDAASAILDVCEKAEIVFVTAYQQYAIEAFELNALDYLLKPVVPERLEKSILRIQNSKSVKTEGLTKPIRIQFLGGFQMFWEGSEGIKWRAEKTKELFIYLLQNRQRIISKDELLDTLWPEDDPARSIKQLYNGIYYIRKNLQEYGIERDQINIDSNYKLSIGNVWFDLERLNTLRHRIESLNELEINELEECTKQEYLKGEYYSWMDYDREQYNLIQENVALELSRIYKEKKLFNKAIEILVNTFRRNVFNEEVVKQLMILYKETNQFANAKLIFNSYKAMMLTEFGIEPSEDIKSILGS